MIFGNRRHFRELLTKSEEGIASNILADRLKMLLQRGIITKAEDPAISRNRSTALQSRVSGGPEMWRGFMIELRQTH